MCMTCALHSMYVLFYFFFYIADRLHVHQMHIDRVGSTIYLFNSELGLSENPYSLNKI